MSQLKESIRFDIELSGDYWFKPPQFRILIDGKKYLSGFADTTPCIYEFTADLEKDQEHLLEIRLENKNKKDTLLDSEKKNIIKDMLLHIHSIKIDEIDLDYLIADKGKYLPDNPNIEPQLNCTDLGYNGSFQLKFSVPFYLWMMENG